MTRTSGAPKPEDAHFMAIALRHAEAAVSLEIIATFPWTPAGANAPNEAGPRG